MRSSLWVRSLVPPLQLCGEVPKERQDGLLRQRHALAKAGDVAADGVLVGDTDRAEVQALLQVAFIDGAGALLVAVVVLLGTSVAPGLGGVNSLELFESGKASAGDLLMITKGSKNPLKLALSWGM